MSDQRYMKLTIPGNGKFCSTLNLREDRVRQFRKRLLNPDEGANTAENDEKMKRLFARDDLKNVKAEWEHGNHNFQETLLLVAVDYLDERKLRNADEKMRLELEAKDLKLDVEGLEASLNKCHEEIRILEQSRNSIKNALGYEYLKRLEEMHGRIAAVRDSLDALEGIQPVAGVLEDKIREKLTKIIMDRRASAARGGNPEGGLILLDNESVEKMMNEVCDALREELNPLESAISMRILGANAMPTEPTIGNMRFRIQSGSDEQRLEIHLRNTVEGLTDLVSEMQKTANIAMLSQPHLVLAETLESQGIDTSWLGDFDTGKAAKIDPKKLRDADKKLGELSRILKKSEKQVRGQTGVLSTTRNRMLADIGEIGRYTASGMLLPEKADAHRKFAEKLEKLTGTLGSFADASSELESILSQMSEVAKDYRKNAYEYCTVCRKLIDMKRTLDGLDANNEKLARYNKIKAEIEKRDRRMDDLAAAHRQFNEELVKTQERGKRSRLHMQNSKKAKPEAEPENTYVAPVRANPTAEELEARRLNLVGEEVQSIAEKALKHKKFKRFSTKKKFIGMRDNFTKTMKEFAYLYYGQKCELGIQQAIDSPVFNNRAKNEGTKARPNSELTLLRLAFGSDLQFRFIIDMSDPANPLFLFAGTADESHAFLKKGKYEQEYLTALKDGRSTWFNGLKNL